MTETITSGQMKQIGRLCEDGLENSQISKEVAQRAIERGDTLQQRLINLIKEIGLQRYSNEKISSDSGYPQGFRILTVHEQVEILLKYFPQLDASQTEGLARYVLPEEAEDWAVIPKPNKLGHNYHGAMNKVLKLLAETYDFKILAANKLTQKHVKVNDKTVLAHLKLNEQPGDFWVFPFQFGQRHRGKSLRRSREVFRYNEFGLGPYEVAILLLSHPDRIQPQHLYIDCAGIDYNPNSDGSFWACLGFDSYDQDYTKRPGMHYYSSDNARSYWGAITGFWPH